MAGKSQPIREIMYISVDDKRTQGIKLQGELAHFRHAEQLYVDKRRQLQELEAAYRKK